MNAMEMRASNNLALTLLFAYRKEISWILIFSFIANVLMLTPTLYMMQVYDRVLIGQSNVTLIILSLTTLLFFLLLMFAEVVRSKMLIVIGNKIEVSLSERKTMSSHSNHAPVANTHIDDHAVDVVESVVHKMPYVLPIAGAVLMFLLAFIAVFMA